MFSVTHVQLFEDSNNKAMFTSAVIHNNFVVGISPNKCQQMWISDLYNKPQSAARTIHGVASYFMAE